jgi:hypothetical protein
MAKFRVIEGTVWEVEADSLDAAKATYEAYFNGNEEASDSMQEIEGNAHWYEEEAMQFTDKERELIIIALSNQSWNSDDTYGQYRSLITAFKGEK